MSTFLYTRTRQSGVFWVTEQSLKVKQPLRTVDNEMKQHVILKAKSSPDQIHNNVPNTNTHEEEPRVYLDSGEFTLLPHSLVWLRV